MRRLIAAFMATALLAPGIANAACLKPGEGTALNVAGLKSQLMVTALACDTRDRYNSFVIGFRSTLVAQDTALNSYFSHHYKRNWRTEHDSYITQLANVQSEAGIQQGTLFCSKNVGLFDQVAAIKSPKELEDFANNADLTMPVAVDICGFHRKPVATPVITTVSAQPGSAKGGVVVAQQTTTEKQKRGFFGNIAHGIGSIF